MVLAHNKNGWAISDGRYVTYGIGESVKVGQRNGWSGVTERLSHFLIDELFDENGNLTKAVLPETDKEIKKVLLENVLG